MSMYGNRFRCQTSRFPPFRCAWIPGRPSTSWWNSVQESLSRRPAGFYAGNPDKGRADLDKAVNLILLSGFQAESDPRLSKLFDQIGETMHAYPRDSGQGVEEEAEEAEAAPPAQPAPIDEIADLTLPAGRSTAGAQGAEGIDYRAARSCR